VTIQRKGRVSQGELKRSQSLSFRSFGKNVSIFAAVEPTLDAALDDIARQALADQPEHLTSLGPDTGANSWPCVRLDDRSAAGRARTLPSITRYRQILGRVNRPALSGHDCLLHDAVAYGLASGAVGAGFPWYEKTPLYALPGLARQLGIAGIWLKE
jgi:uncharacterized protein (DUF885 family)